MASRGNRREPPADPPWWFDLMLMVLGAFAITLALWPVGYASHVVWALLERGWRAAA